MIDQNHTLAALPSGRNRSTHSTGGWLGLSAGMDVTEETLLVLPGIEPPSYPSSFDYSDTKLKIQITITIIIIIISITTLPPGVIPTEVKYIISSQQRNKLNTLSSCRPTTFNQPRDKSARNSHQKLLV
jgi:hypothetical protein